jgi:predicted glycoside hydrolase/deacetylase ChbG (UPF0249 family)
MIWRENMMAPFNNLNLIISADDFGISEIANDRILEAATQGKLHRVAVMVEGIFSKEQLTALAQTGVALDIHLTLPQAAKNATRKLKDSALRRSFSFLFRYVTREIASQKIEQRWKRQIMHFYSLLRRYPDGINSHEYVHLFPPFFRITLILCQEFNIHYLRVGQRHASGIHTPIAIILNWLRTRDKRIYQLHRITTSEYLVSLDWLDLHKDILLQLPSGTTELVCHPERSEEMTKIMSLR